MRKYNLITKLIFIISFLLISLLGFAQITQRGTATTATSSGTTLNISKPSGIVVGDIMIANFSQSSNSGAKTITSDVSLSGWTLIAGANLGNNSRRGTVLYKIAVSTDLSTSTYTFSLDGDTDSVSGGIIAFSGVDSSAPFDITPGTLNITNTNSITASSLTTVTANTAIIMLGQVGGSTSAFSSWSTTSPGTLTELFEIFHNSGKKTAAAAAWAIKATAGPTGSGTATITDERNGSILLALRPAVACVTPPTTANAGIDQTLAACATTATLSGNTPTLGIGVWSLVSGTATITSPTSPTSGITGLTVGSTATLRWTISNGGCTPSTDDVDITTVTGSACLNYCIPSYSSGSGSIDQITKVSLGTLINTSGASSSPYYTFFNSVTKPDLTPSTTASVSVTFGSDANQYAAVWIDFNQNGTFETGEGAVSGNAGSNGTVTINIPVPAGALAGNTRMRVRGGDDSALTTSQACGASNSTYGETEDYIVNIVSLAPPTITSFTPSSGCPGSSITINGTNLTGATTVKIGGTAVASITSNTATQIVAVIGSGTTGTVSVTTAGGTATSVATFTIISGPTQPSTIIGNSSPCSGTSQIYSVTAVGGVTYNWTFPSGWVQTAGGTTSSVTVTTNGTAGTITVTPSNGCSGTARTLSVSPTSATVNAANVLTSICSGGTTTALGGSFGGSATGAIWSSSAGGTFANNTGTTPNTATWTPPPAYFGTATLTLTTTGGTCTSVNATKNQVVNSGALTIATVGAELTIVGSLTSTSLGGNTPTSGTGSWSKISGPSGSYSFSSSSSPTATATVSTIGTYVFRWTITSSCGSSFAEITVKYISDTDNRKNTLFYEDFDANNGNWTNTTTTNGSWLWTSSFPSGTGETGENSFWRINNYNNYANNATIEIESPVYNFSGFENLLFSIDVRYRTETNNDGMRILYSINGGTYQLLGTNTSGENWYNTATVSALGSNGWSGNSATSSLAFTPIGDGADRFLKASTLLADATFRNQSNVRFKIQFKSNSSTTDQGVAFDNLTVQGDPIVPLALSPNAPAKINQNLKLWFKSNAGISATDGAPLTSWEDQAYDVTRADLVDKENAKAVGTDAPTYRDSPSRNMNFNPVADFNSANKNYMNGKGGLYSQDYFLVVHSDDIVEPNTGSSGRQIVLGGKSTTSGFHEDPTGLGFGNATARYSNEIIAHNVGSYTPGSGSPTPGIDSYGRACTSTTTTYNEPIIINVKTNANGTETEIYKNGIKIDDTTGKTGDTGTGTTLNYYEYRNLPFYLGTGRSGISGRAYSALNGKLSEVIAYSAPNSGADQQKIQSYLGIKYGITLHSVTSSNVTSVSTTSRLNDIDYVDSQGNIFWNTTTNTGFNYDIAGIGRDDNSQLQQKQSKSVNTTDEIAIGLGTLATTNSANNNTFDSDRKFLVWGNNNGSLAAQPAVAVNMSAGITPALSTNVSFVSVGRTWKVVETGGDVPSCKVSIPTTMLSATLTPPGDYLMFISNTPNFDPTAEYRIMKANGSNLETDYDFNGTKYVTFGFAPEKTYTRSISFDGVDDYLDAGNVLNLNSSFTISAWIKRIGGTTSQTILSKRNSSFTIGYDLSTDSTGKVVMSWMNGTKKTITSNVAIPVGIWHNVAVTYSGSTALIYIDGVQSKSATLSSVPTNTQSFLIAAADGTNPTSFFKGTIDEVRVWNVALTPSQLRYVMNQEILSNGLATNGTIIPNSITQNDISSIPWTNLSAYYPMSTYTYTNAKDISNNNYTAALRNLTTVDLQTAPLPYESIANGTWQTPATWLNSAVQDLPNSVSLVDNTKTVDWNIVKTSNNIMSTGNKTLLGLFVNSNTLTASSDTKIEVTNYLKLDGKIDLVGMSQLVQTNNSDLDVTSTGSIERDQQGQASKYNYNYWCSPVSPTNTTQNNKDYTIAGVMKDGFNAIPREITWIAGYDGIPGNASTPMSIARYWLNKFDNYANSYANWVQITENSTLRTGQGYTMKGSGTSGTQNYTFVGKPNNGLINSNTIGSDQLLLTGNPYPSALDADAFITDNISSVGGSDGTLYFWDHYTTNNTHILADYQGGYGVRNLTGGIAPVSTGIDYINQSGVSSKSAPQQYIPVGQGFFVNGKIGSTGTIIFKNSQRAFYKETDTANSNSMFKTRSGTSKTSNTDHWNDNSNDTDSNENYKKIRLGFNSNNNYHRQLLLGFMDDKATDEMDYGYDAISLDDMPNDMYFLLGENQLVIQGVGSFDENASYPIGVKTDVEGKVSFTVDEMENFDSQQKIYIHDNLTDTYNEIQTTAFEINMPIGTDDTRFSLRFKDNSSNNTKTLGVEENNLISNDIKIMHINKENTVVINNNSTNVLVEKVTLFNILGQTVESWKVENQEQKNIQLPLKNRTTGVYIAKLKTSKGEISKKIIF